MMKYFAHGLYLSNENECWRLGLSEKGQYELGDVIYAELPENLTSLEVGGDLLSAEGAKSVSDLSSPVSGKITQWNEKLGDHPELLNSKDPSDRWIVELQMIDNLEMLTLYDDVWIGEGEPEDFRAE